MAKRKKDETPLGYRLYTKLGPDGLDHYYADFRQIGGQRVALIPNGEKRATVDSDVALTLAAAIAVNLIAKKHTTQRQAAGVEARPAAKLKAYAAHHLREKKKAGSVTDDWLVSTEHSLDFAISYFGATTELTAIGVPEMQSFVNWARSHGGRSGNKKRTNSTLRHYLNALSNLYRRAQSEGAVPPGFNPVAAMIEKPAPRREEAKWLEVHEGALLLESARTYQAPPESRLAFPYMHALVAGFLLTGARKSELLGLQVSDISFERKTVTFRVNSYRRLKTEGSARVVPLWPQLEEVLRDHLRTAGIAGGLLFQPKKETATGMIVDFRKQLDAIAERAGWAAGEIRTKMFRHTYCTARLQTVDGDAPVSPFTVARELGHGGLTLVNKVYGHLGTVRHRSDVVEYRTSIIKTIGDTELRNAFTDRLKALKKKKGVA